MFISMTMITSQKCRVINENLHIRGTISVKSVATYLWSQLTYDHKRRISLTWKVSHKLRQEKWNPKLKFQTGRPPIDFIFKPVPIYIYIYITTDMTLNYRPMELQRSPTVPARACSADGTWCHESPCPPPRGIMEKMPNYEGVYSHGGTRKWMVCNGTSYKNAWSGGTPHFRKPPYGNIWNHIYFCPINHRCQAWNIWNIMI